MNGITVDRPAPACILHATNPARAHVPACQTDVAKTFSEHDLSILDSYELTDRLGYLEQAGAFRG